MQKAILFSLQIVMPAANYSSYLFPIVGCIPVGWPVQEVIGKLAANYLRTVFPILGCQKCASFRLDFRISYTYLPTVFYGLKYGNAL